MNDNKIKGRNIIIKKDNKILHQFIDDGSNNNNIDITVQLSNEKPKDLLYLFRKGKKKEFMQKEKKDYLKY